MNAISISQLTLVSLIFFSFISSLLINYVLLKFAKTLGIRNKNENEVRWSENYKPSLGGISFYINFLFSFIFFMMLNPDISEIKWMIFGFFTALSLAFLMGLADDAFNTQPLLKLITQILCALVLVYSGIYIRLFESEILNYVLTIIWIIGMMNSFNLLDNMDGITGMIALVLCFFFSIIGFSNHVTNNYFDIYSLCLAGTLIGFLVFNFHPSKMYMGDSGSQFIGLFLATIGIEVCWNNHESVISGTLHTENICLVLLVFVLPLTDTITVFVNRISKGNSPLIGGKDHTTHHLFFNGFTEKRIAFIYFLITIISCILAYYIIISPSTLLMLCSYLYVLIVFLILYLNTVLNKPWKNLKK